MSLFLLTGQGQHQRAGQVRAALGWPPQSQSPCISGKSGLLRHRGSCTQENLHGAHALPGPVSTEGCRHLHPRYLLRVTDASEVCLSVTASWWGPIAAGGAELRRSTAARQFDGQPGKLGWNLFGMCTSAPRARADRPHSASRITGQRVMQQPSSSTEE